MKQILAMLMILLPATMLFAQDVITLKNGEVISGKVAEVGSNEIKYYKAINLSGPVYVANKSDVSLITYQNGTKDVFPNNVAPQAGTAQSPNVIVSPSPQVVVVERPVRRGWPLYPIFLPHIDLGHHGGGHHGGGHGRGHH